VSTSFEKKSKYVIWAGWISIIANSLLFIGKYLAGIWTDSVALIADSWHTLSDSVSSIALLIGIFVSRKPADNKHPFGHGRMELVVTLFIGFLLGIVALNFFKESYERFSNDVEVVYSPFAIVITVISILVKEGLARYSMWAGKKSGSKAVQADAWHHRSDAITSIVILIGIFLAPYFWWVDIALGIVVSGFILYTAYEIVWEAISGVIGEDADNDLCTEIHTLCNEVLGKDSGVHHLHLHNYGIHKEITFHIKLPNKMLVEEAHVITDNMESKIREELGYEATIHIDPESLFN
jgi:cation diffusion facilitator family transporter